MEEFMLENADRYKTLVNGFKPAPASKKAASETTSASSDIIVATRIRPMLADETTAGFPESVFRRGDTNTVDIHELRRPVRGLPTLNSSSYTVDQVFGPYTSTSTIYKSLVQPLVPWAWGGGVGTLFSYGQTGSGKTFTVSGLERHVGDTLMSGTLEGERKVYMCIIELAGQTAYDLLNSRKQISILEDSLGTTQLAGALEHHITSLDSWIEYVNIAASLRKTESTFKNDTSSRSHAICRIRIENPALPSADDGLLYLVDLAGSEAARDRSTHDASRMKEAREINTSLSVLKDCIRGRALIDAEALSADGGKQAKKAYVPFRQSTLTKTLKHVFDPAGARSLKTVVVACVNPCLADVGASKNTLRYAELLRVVVPKAEAVEYDPFIPTTWDNAQLRAWIDTSSGTPAVSSSILTPLETGPQLLRLPVPEFLARCLKTSGVSKEQAQAFQTKFWKLHIDSKKRSESKITSKEAPALAGGSGSSTREKAPSRLELMNSSVDPEPGAASIPFKQRIRPGMVVSYNAPPVWSSTTNLVPVKQLAVVLCPATAVNARVKDMQGVQVNPGTTGTEQAEGDDSEKRKPERYLCSMVLPGIMPGSYGIGLWHQGTVDVDQMEAEVVLEYDPATRFYYMAV
ncbi:P-loop containing nucleoside triphosphate hydrolase protein [Podospora didyma]|uniref:P-loop containing nucleoside triphosphate hydrolase protein n=1 Tax=Podospora didyma TaxID=330526 RepID=A0AAE0NR36_9PEZI|nr:P-loop containing nucleoside triphosphate hydrolase protein [Podospora didyma]